MDAQAETTTPIEEKDSFNWRLFILWPLVVLLLYVLSLGPVLLMKEKGRIQADNKLVGNFYCPLDWAYKKTILHKPLGMYFHLWRPDRFDKHGEMNYGWYDRFTPHRQLKQYAN